jgi:hypothetical protein
LEIRQLKETIAAKDIRVQELVQQVSNHMLSAAKCMHCTVCTICMAQVCSSLSSASCTLGLFVLAIPPQADVQHAHLSETVYCHSAATA